MSSLLATVLAWTAIGVGGGWSYIQLQTAPMDTVYFNAVISAVPTVLGFVAGTYLEAEAREVNH